MSAPERPEVKICGLTRREDAAAAAALGADYLGAVLSRGFRRSVPPEAAGTLLVGLRPVRVAVLVDESVERAVDLAGTLDAGVIQLHGSEPPEVAAELGAERRWRIWKSVRARSGDDVRRCAERYGSSVEAILVEGFREGVVGGGGVRLPEGEFGSLRDLVPATLRIVLAGGLTPETVGAAVDHFEPHVVDVSSGVELEPGRKSPELVGWFIRAAGGGASPADAPGHPVRRGGTT